MYHFNNGIFYNLQRQIRSTEYHSINSSLLTLNLNHVNVKKQEEKKTLPFN